MDYFCSFFIHGSFSCGIHALQQPETRDQRPVVSDLSVLLLQSWRGLRELRNRACMNLLSLPSGFGRSKDLLPSLLPGVGGNPT